MADIGRRPDKPARQPRQRAFVDLRRVSELDPVATCEKSVEEDIALAPGTVPGKAGGLVFLFAPYELGSYAEGGYSVVVPLDAFAALLSPDWAGQFAGAPTEETLRLYRAG